MSVFKTIAAAAAAIVVTVGAATASTTFYLGGWGGLSYSHSYSKDGIGLTVEAYKHDQGVLGEQIKVGQWGRGLGACSKIGSYGCKESHQVDGYGAHETIKFSFDHKVRIESVKFTYVDWNDDFEFGSYSNGVLETYQSDIAIPIDGYFPTYAGWEGYGTYEFVGGPEATMFSVGSDYKFDNFKIKAIEVSKVPLPAGAALLLTGLVGLAVLRRRRGIVA
ncbi:MAG: VPLPA-CTERM sorting domain-containing protein [Pseudomonadota bacterium]